MVGQPFSLGSGGHPGQQKIFWGSHPPDAVEQKKQQKCCEGKKKEAEEPSGLSALLPWALSSRNIIIYQKMVRVGTALKNGHVRVRIIYFKVRIFIGDN